VRRIEPRRTSPLALMKLTSSRMRPGAAKPTAIGHSARIAGSEASTPRRQNACVRARSAGESASSTRRSVIPEKIVSSTTASETADSASASASWPASDTPSGLTTA